MFDTHCHLNFKTFSGKENEVIERARKVGIKLFLVPGTDFETSKKSVELAKRFPEVYSAVGIHPHHVFGFLEKKGDLRAEVNKFHSLLSEEKVVAVGEVGVDRHLYKKTKYQEYEINEKFLYLQKLALREQLRIALEHNKALVLHNREASEDLLKFLNENWDDKLKERVVFHCCEPKEEILEFAKEKRVFIGFDGDLTYRVEKQVFFKKVTLDLLVFETDSPFLTPEPVRKQKRFPNEPANLVYIIELASYLKKIPEEKLVKISFENSKRLFGI